MDRATAHVSKAPARWAAVLLVLAACTADAGCARMNPFHRNDPPMLGSSAGNARDAKGTAVARNPTARPSSSNDLYPQSFGRPQPKPSPADTSRDDGTATAST